MDKRSSLNGERILLLLHELDSLVTERFRLIICGGAAAIVAYGLKRLTGDIDTFEPVPKSHEFYQKIKEIQEAHGLDSSWFNESAKGFSDCLCLNYKKRLVPIDKGFNNLEVYAISKADLITMKLCAWRESDKYDIDSIGIAKADMEIIDENISYLQNHRPDLADKAVRVLTELGFKKAKPLSPNDVGNLAELIQFYREQTDNEASIEEIQKWKERVSDGLRFSSIARSISKNKEKNNGLNI